MDRLKHILVPTDYSEYSRVGLEYALALAEMGPVRVTVVHVVESSSHRRNQPGAKERQSANDAMRKFLSHPGASVVTGIVRRGSPVEEIIRFARAEHVDVIVIATHGRTGLAHVLIGSVAEKIVRYSSVPVLSVKPKEISQKLLSENDILRELHLPLLHETEL